jgi:hypothetical protein
LVSLAESLQGRFKVKSLRGISFAGGGSTGGGSVLVIPWPIWSIEESGNLKVVAAESRLGICLLGVQSSS